MMRYAITNASYKIGVGEACALAQRLAEKHNRINTSYAFAYVKFGFYISLRSKSYEILPIFLL